MFASGLAIRCLCASTTTSNRSSVVRQKSSEGVSQGDDIRHAKFIGEKRCAVNLLSRGYRTILVTRSTVINDHVPKKGH